MAKQKNKNEALSNEDKHLKELDDYANTMVDAFEDAQICDEILKDLGF
jgi:hypothetical protein